MKHDEAHNELEEFKKKALDSSIWGQYEHIILWSRIYQLKVEIHSHSMTTQIINGDEYNLKNDSIKLLHCNKAKWGDTENHYDLLHEMNQQNKKGKSYERRTDEQQAEYKEKRDRMDTSKLWHDSYTNLTLPTTNSV